MCMNLVSHHQIRQSRLRSLTRGPWSRVRGSCWTVQWGSAVRPNAPVCCGSGSEAIRAGAAFTETRSCSRTRVTYQSCGPLCPSPSRNTQTPECDVRRSIWRTGDLLPPERSSFTVRCQRSLFTNHKQAMEIQWLCRT